MPCVFNQMIIENKNNIEWYGTHGIVRHSHVVISLGSVPALENSFILIIFSLSAIYLFRQRFSAKTKKARSFYKENIFFIEIVYRYNYICLYTHINMYVINVRLLVVKNSIQLCYNNVFFFTYKMYLF